MMGSATRVCSDVSLNLVDNEACAPPMQPDTEASLDLQLEEDSMMMMPSPTGPVFVNPSLELIQQPGNEYGDDSLQTNLDIMYLETFGNMTHANQLAEIAQIEDELKLQQQLEVENEFKNAEHLQNGVQLQNMVFNFETENDGLDNERRDLFEEIDIESPPLPIPLQMQENLQVNSADENIMEVETSASQESLLPLGGESLTYDQGQETQIDEEMEAEIELKTETPSELEMKSLPVETKNSELETKIVSESETKNSPQVEIKISVESETKNSSEVETSPILESQDTSEEELQNVSVEPISEPILQDSAEENQQLPSVDTPWDDDRENIENEPVHIPNEVDSTVVGDHEKIESMKKQFTINSSESENNDLKQWAVKPGDKRTLLDINSMKAVIASRNKPFREPLVPSYLYKGLDKDDELLRAFNARQDESMTCICVLCYKWVADKPALAKHMIDEHKNHTALEKCKFCHRTFFARFLRLRHEKIHKYDMEHHHSLYYPDLDKPFDYLVPNHFYKRFKYAPFTKEYSRKIEDITAELENVSYECCDCGRIFRGEEPLREHYERRHAVQICPICHQRFLDLKTLKKHEGEEHDLKPVTRNYQGGAWQFWRNWEEDKIEEMKTIVSNIEFMHTYAYREDESDELGVDTKDLIERTIERQLDMKTSFKRPFSTEEGGIPINAKRSRQSFNKKSVPVLETNVVHQSEPLPIVPVPIPPSQPDPQSLSSQNRCEICNELFLSSEDVILHMQKSHNNERPYKCQFCGRGFATHSNRKEHERIHTGERPYVCIFCNRGFIQISNLKKHMQTHKDKNNLQCKTCGKQFVKESSLILHQRAHAVDRKFKCAHCDKAYNYSSLLKRHERIHTGEMPYSCDICMMPFHELVSLTYHRKKVHTGERPHKCTTCGRAFILSSDLKKHMKVHWKDSSKDDDGCDGSEGSDSDSIDSLLRRELLEDGNNLIRPKNKKFMRTYVPNKSTTLSEISEKYGSNETKSSEFPVGPSDPPAGVYHVFEDELEEINSIDSKISKSKSSLSKHEAEMNSTSNNDAERDTTVVWMENGDDADGKFIVVDDDGNEINGDGIEICEVFDD